MNTRQTRLLVVTTLIAVLAVAAFAGGPYGNFSDRQHGVMDGNLVYTDFYNYGMIANWNAELVTIWPKGTIHGYIDGVALIVIGEAQDTSGATIHPMATMYREDMGNDYDPETGLYYGWEPIGGYSNANQDEPAMSDNIDSWPFTWPDKDASWAGYWNGYFGKGVTNADLETFFVMDDSNDKEFAFYPDSTDSLRRGMGLWVEVRAFQWTQVLAEDCIFWHYDIENISTTDYEKMAFGMLIDWGVGGAANSSDDAGRYNTALDIAYAWDLDNLGDYGWSPVGYAGYAFLESPGIGTDGTDNDDDGLVDETRDSGPGTYYSTATSIGTYGDPIPHWSGDEDGDWDSFLDRNENGVWDSDEPLNDDVGADGIGPADDGWFGADEGEGDGIPTNGEPDFDGLDKDESDQIGLTSFHIFPVHQYALSNETENWELARIIVPPTDDQLQQGVNLGMMFFSGTFPLMIDKTERFSMALLFGNDLDDLTRNKETVQSIYNANYNFAQPPDKPTLEAYAGDGKVVLHWDAVSEDSYDKFLLEYDFEGYRIYRSTDPSFIDTRLITDAYGNITYRTPLVQYDLKDGRFGPHPVGVYGAHFDMGEETGIRHTYVDTTVTNGVTYYYAVVAYDYGKVAGETIIDTTIAYGEDGVPYDSITVYFIPELDETGNIVGIPPSECTSTILGNVGETVQLDMNTAAVTPNAPAAGYRAPEVDGEVIPVFGETTGRVIPNVLYPDSVVDGRIYEIRFKDAGLYKGVLNFARAFEVVDAETEELLYESDSLAFGYFGPYEDGVDPNYFLTPNTSRAKFFRQHPDSTEFWHQGAPTLEIPAIDGVTIAFDNVFIDYADDDDIGLDGLGWASGPNTNYTIMCRILPVLNSYSLKVPYNFEVRWVGEDTVASQNLLGAYLPDSVNFEVWNTTLQERIPFGVRRDYYYTDTDTLMQKLYIQPILNTSPTLLPWGFELTAPVQSIITVWNGVDSVEAISHIEHLPEAGDILRLVAPIPFTSADTLRFAISGASYSNTLAKSDLERIAVVPNPYIGSAIWEPRVTTSSGRGERKVDFIHLPPKCTIRVYTLAGYHVRTIEHNKDYMDGAESWNLVSKDGMDISYGVYVYHVDAPGVGEHIGKFAVIK